MALFEEDKVANSPFKEFKPNDEVAKGESFGFLWLSNGSGTSADYGEFVTWQGLKVDLTAASEEALLESATPIGFIPNTMLKGKEENGAVLQGNLYRIEKAWDQGDKYDGNKKAKGFGYNVFLVKAPAALIAKLKDLDPTKPANQMAEESTDTPVDV